MPLESDWSDLSDMSDSRRLVLRARQSLKGAPSHEQTRYRRKETRGI